MGVKIFRDDNWNRITNGVISRKDIMHLDGKKDRELIGYLIAHASEPCRRSMMKYAAKKYGFDGMPEPPKNIDDPDDARHEEFLVLQEQVAREEDDAVLYDIACRSDTAPAMRSIREKAARLIRNRDYQYALSSHILNPARTSMILDLYDSLEGDELFIARTILTDPNDRNKAHMLLYCRDEALLMLGWKYVYGERRFSTDRLHAMGSRFPEAYEEMEPKDRTQCEREWLGHAAELALEILSEDEAVRERLSGRAAVDSEPLHFFLSIHHPRKAVRWWHTRKLENPAYIAYVGSWTSDDQIKEALSFKINSTAWITEMIYGDLSGADLVFGFRKPEDLTLQDRFCMEIMKNHPDRAIREHVRTELLRGDVEIPGVDLTKPDPLYKRNDIRSMMGAAIMDENDPEKEPEKSLRSPVGVWFSELKDNWEERGFYYDFSFHNDDRQDAVFRCYGSLPDGSRFGAYVFPSMISWADFRNPPWTCVVIVDKNSEMRSSTFAEHEHLLWLPEEHGFPMAIAASPSGKSLVWITEGELWVWHADPHVGRFISDDGETETRFGDKKVRDARMHEDGILEVVLEDGEIYGLFCDEDMLLRPFEDGWVPGDENSFWSIRQPMSYWPESLRLMVRKSDEGWTFVNLGGDAYNNCDVRRVCFEPGLETIKSGMLAGNIDLEAVVIPDYVKQVESCAFLGCENLIHLVIEGDLSRTANWAEDAFDGCACEAYYKTLRNTYLI